MAGLSLSRERLCSVARQSILFSRKVVRKATNQCERQMKTGFNDHVALLVGLVSEEEAEIVKTIFEQLHKQNTAAFQDMKHVNNRQIDHLLDQATQGTISVASNADRMQEITTANDAIDCTLDVVAATRETMKERLLRQHDTAVESIWISTSLSQKGYEISSNHGKLLITYLLTQMEVQGRRCLQQVVQTMIDIVNNR